MKKFFASFVFIVLFGGYAAFQYLNSSSATYAATQPVTTVQSPTTSSQTLASNTSAQSAPPSPEDQSDGGSDDGSESASTQTAPTQTQPAQTTQTQTTQTQPTQTTKTTTASKPKGQYIDGTYTGSVADAYYGNVQVQAVISGGKLANVVVLQYPSDRSTSRFINQQAMPILVSEAIQAQSANVNGVSGASESSPAFVQSLAFALAQAKS